MKKLFISVLVLIFFATALSAATIKLRTLGQSPFYGWVENSEVARQLVKDEIGAVKYALDNTGYGEIFFALCEQINQVRIEEKKIFPGQTIDQKIEWMLFKSRGFQRVIKNLEWAGNGFEAFAFYVDYRYKRYYFVIPQICGNISLLGVTDIVRIQISETKEKEEEIVKIDEPETVEEEIRPGPEPEKSVRVKTSLPRITGALDISGALVRKCYGKYLPGVRLGLRYRLDNQDRFAFVLTGGFMTPLPINQSNWEPFFISDVTLRTRVYKSVSLGVGAGYSSKARNWKVPAYWEGVLNLQVNVFFVELRVPWTWEEWNEVKSFGPKFPHKFIFGIRLPIKK